MRIDKRAVYRWSWLLGKWVFHCSGRAIGACPIKVEPISCEEFHARGYSWWHFA